MKRLLIAVFALLVSATYAKENPVVMFWPTQGQPGLKLSFYKLQMISTVAGQSTYVSDVTVENLTDKLVPRIYFDVYVNDKAGARIGEGVLTLSNIGPSQLVKTQVQVACVGTPANFSLAARKDMLAQPGPKTVPLKIVSNPPGAKLKVDGEDAGMTPAIVRLTVGTHSLLLNKEGYATGTTSLDIAPDELPGGSITIDLGGMSKDAVELRDGTTILGDVLSMTLASVVVHVNGADQTYDRNRVKKILLVERIVQQSPGQAGVSQPN